MAGRFRPAIYGKLSTFSNPHRCRTNTDIFSGCDNGRVSITMRPLDNSGSSSAKIVFRCRVLAPVSRYVASKQGKGTFPAKPDTSDRETRQPVDGLATRFKILSKSTILMPRSRRMRALVRVEPAAPSPVSVGTDAESTYSVVSDTAKGWS